MATLIAVVSVSSGAETSHTFAFLAIAREDPEFYQTTEIESFTSSFLKLRMHCCKISCFFS